MGIWKDKKKRELLVEVLFYLLVFASITCFAMIQTYGDPPDEINRFKVVNYICNHGRLPHGADPEVILAGYGASYAFQPILTYIIQGFLLRFLRLFTSDGYVLLLAARMVNVVFGVLMAYYVRCIAKEAWKNPYIQWVFTLMVVFLPQNIFIHSYVNTDSMAMLAVAMIFYVLLRAQRTNYSRNDCILLAVGIILCAMSYYNAYGIIVAAILIFVLNYIHIGKKTDTVGVVDEMGEAERSVATANVHGQRRGLWIEWKPLLQKGCLISVIVLLGIGWWFIRNAVLYDGDLIAMNARRECAIETATPDYNPLTRFTYQNSGTPLSEMLFATGYVTLLRDSFIAMFGPMIIPTHGLIYLFYKRFWIVAGAIAILPVQWLWKRGSVAGQKKEYSESPKRGLKQQVVFYSSMTLFCVITIGLSIYYSYTWEFQPQGRYILPVLIPLMYLVTLGVEKSCSLMRWCMDMVAVKISDAKKQERISRIGNVLGCLACLGIMAYVMLAFVYSLFVRFIPYYMEGSNMFSMYGKTFVP